MAAETPLAAHTPMMQQYHWVTFYTMYFIGKTLCDFRKVTPQSPYRPHNLGGE